MAELPEWFARALRYEGSNGPVKVVYLRSRLEVVTDDSFDPNSGWPKDRPELGKHQMSGASDTRAVFSGNLFEAPVEDLDFKNYISEGEECFVDEERALEDLASKLNISPSYGPRDIEPSKDAQLLLLRFLRYVTNANDSKGVQTGIQEKKREEDKKKKGKDDREMMKDSKGRGGGKKGGGSGKKDEEKKIKDEGKERKEEKKMKEVEDDGKKDEEKKIKDEGKKRKEEEKKRKEDEEILEKRRELDGMTRRDVRRSNKCALIVGITTKFNPSGIWIVEDFFYDEEVE